MSAAITKSIVVVALATTASATIEFLGTGACSSVDSGSQPVMNVGRDFDEECADWECFRARCLASCEQAQFTISQCYASTGPYATDDCVVGATAVCAAFSMESRNDMRCRLHYPPGVEFISEFTLDGTVWPYRNHGLNKGGVTGFTAGNNEWECHTRVPLMTSSVFEAPASFTFKVSPAGDVFKIGEDEVVWKNSVGSRNSFGLSTAEAAATATDVVGDEFATSDGVWNVVEGGIRFKKEVNGLKTMYNFVDACSCDE